jgi:hypothetical protein
VTRQPSAQVTWRPTSAALADIRSQRTMPSACGGALPASSALRTEPASVPVSFRSPGCSPTTDLARFGSAVQRLSRAACRSVTGSAVLVPTADRGDISRFGSVRRSIISEPPAHFSPFAAPFQEALANYGRSPLPVRVHGPGHVVPIDEQAREEFWPHWRADEARGTDGPVRSMLNVGHNVAMALGGPRWSLKRAHFVSTAVFDNEHSLTFAHGGDRLPDQPGDGRLVCRAVADNQCPTTLGQAFDHPLKR